VLCGGRVSPSFEANFLPTSQQSISATARPITSSAHAGLRARTTFRCNRFWMWGLILLTESERESARASISAVVPTLAEHHLIAG